MGDIGKYISSYELLPKREYQLYKAGQLSSRVIDKRLVSLLDFIRGRFAKSIMVNNWTSGGLLEFRGYRPYDYKGGALYSDHRHGKAADLNIASMISDEVYADIVGNADIYMRAGLTIIEDKSFTQGWTHVSIADSQSSGLWVIKP